MLEQLSCHSIWLCQRTSSSTWSTRRPIWVTVRGRVRVRVEFRFRVGARANVRDRIRVRGRGRVRVSVQRMGMISYSSLFNLHFLGEG